MSEIPISEIQKLDPSAVIELFQLDATSLGGDILYFHSGTNELSQNIVWNSQVYVRYPIKVSGFEMTGDGAFPRPKLAVSNALSAISTIILLYDDLIGAKVTRKRTLKKFLDAVNFEGGVNPDEDPTAEFPEDIYFIDRKSREDADFVEFELASAIDLSGIKLPRRQIIQNVCIWKYRGAECGFTGAPHFDINDNLIQSATTPEGQAVVAAKLAADAALVALNEAEAALSAATANKATQCDYQLTESKYNVTVVGAEVTSHIDGVLVDEERGTQNAKLLGVPVTLGNQYRIGKLQMQKQVDWGFGHTPMTSFFRIEYWTIDPGACSTATTGAGTALTNRNNAKNDYDAALVVLADAFAALPEDDPIYKVDRCGKRLSSCKLRFGENEPLPFGSFPSASLIK